MTKSKHQQCACVVCNIIPCLVSWRQQGEEAAFHVTITVDSSSALTGVTLALPCPLATLRITLLYNTRMLSSQAARGPVALRPEQQNASKMPSAASPPTKTPACSVRASSRASQGASTRMQLLQQPPQCQQQGQQQGVSRLEPAGTRWEQGVSRLVSGVTAAAVALGSLLRGPAASAMPLHALAEQQYEQQVQRLHHKQPRSNLPSSDEAAALQMLMDPDLFTPEAWQGMLQLQRYASYVEQLSVAGVEEGPGCESCTANRMMLEKVGQLPAARAGPQHIVYHLPHQPAAAAPHRNRPQQSTPVLCLVCCWILLHPSQSKSAAQAPHSAFSMPVALCLPCRCLRRPGRRLLPSTLTHTGRSTRRSGRPSCWLCSRRTTAPCAPALTPTRPSQSWWAH